MSQLPNFAFSVPLAMFYCAAGDDMDKDLERGEESSGSMLESSSQKLQEALITFPSVSSVDFI